MLPVAAPPRQRGVIAAEDACGVSPEQVTIGSSGEGVANVDFLLTFGVGQRPPAVDDDLP